LVAGLESIVFEPSDGVKFGRFDLAAQLAALLPAATTYMFVSLFFVFSGWETIHSGFLMDFVH